MINYNKELIKTINMLKYNHPEFDVYIYNVRVSVVHNDTTIFECPIPSALIALQAFEVGLNWANRKVDDTQTLKCLTSQNQKDLNELLRKKNV